jgi:hypothetical protein
MRALLNAASAGLEDDDLELVKDALLNGVADWLKRNGFFPGIE